MMPEAVKKPDKSASAKQRSFAVVASVTVKVGAVEHTTTLEQQSDTPLTDEDVAAVFRRLQARLDQQAMEKR